MVNKKIGKFKVWQLVAVGVAIGVIYYFYSKNSGTETTEPEYGYLTGTEGEETAPTGSGGSESGGSGGGSSTSNGIAETLGVLEGLRNAGLIPSGEASGTPEREVLETQTEGPEPRTNAEVQKAQANTRAARKAEHKAEVALNKAKAKSKQHENKHTQKHNTTGGSAHTPHAHHAKQHPAKKAHAAKHTAKQIHHKSRGTNEKNDRNRNKHRG